MLDAGEFEIDVVGESLRSGDRWETEVLAELEFGLLRRLMVEVEVPYLFLDPDDGNRVDGVGDVELEFKGAILEAAERPLALAVGGDVSLLTGDEERGLGESETEVGIFSAAGERWAWASIHEHLFVEVARGSIPEWGATVAVDATPWIPELSFLLAVNTEFQGGTGPSWVLIPGWEYRWEEPDLQIGAGFPLGLSEEAEDWGVIVDVEIEF